MVIGWVLSALVDSLITFTLCFYLRKRRTSIKRQDIDINHRKSTRISPFSSVRMVSSLASYYIASTLVPSHRKPTTVRDIAFIILALILHRLFAILLVVMASDRPSKWFICQLISIQFLGLPTTLAFVAFVQVQSKRLCHSIDILDSTDRSCSLRNIIFGVVRLGVLNSICISWTHLQLKHP
jgi:hypothetical protein